MNEPTYIFKKGEGWVIQTGPDCPHVFFEHSGKKWVLEFRPPKDGEYFLVCVADAEMLKLLANELTRLKYKPSTYRSWPHNHYHDPNRTVVYREIT